MAITNEATTVYEFDGSSEQNTVNSNINSVEIVTNQGLNLTKVASPSNFVPGEIITYTITITNSSSSFLNGVRIIDNIGGGNLAYVVGSARLTAGSQTYSVTPVATNPLTFALQQLASGATMTLTYRCQVIFNLPNSVETIINNVQGIGYTSSGTIVGYANARIERSNNMELSLSKSASVTSAFSRQPISYFLTLTNNTDVNATAISIVDQLPSNFVVTSVSLKIGSGSTNILSGTDYNLTSANLFSLPSSSGPVVRVLANSSTIVTINGYFN